MPGNSYYPDRRPGERSCLKCGKKFKSVDVTANRICKNCSEANYNERTNKPFRCGGDISEPV